MIPFHIFELILLFECLRHYLSFCLEKYFSGIKEMNKVPDAVIIVGQGRELTASKECLKLNIPLISILDTNCDPTLADFVIPANDDSFRSVSIILSTLSDAINNIEQ